MNQVPPVEQLSYERALELLDQKLRALEESDLSLEGALAAVDEARLYLRTCQERLEAARKKIEVRPETPVAGDERDERETPRDTLL